MTARPLTAEEVLSAWERGRALSPAARALALAALGTGEPEDALAGLPVGDLDARLLDARERTFGAWVEAVASCPECAADLEVRFRVADVRVEPPDDGTGPLSVTAGGRSLVFRLPRAGDLVRLGGTDPRRALLDLCLIDGPAALSEDDVRAVADAMALADPQADVRLAVTCEACAHAFEAPFDIGGYLWNEIEARALRLLGDVHALARAYGWSEREVLALSDERRGFYLEAVSG